MKTYEACNEAAAFLKQAGFVLVNASMKTEATYYRLPGRAGVIRVAEHTGGKSPPGLDRILARLTFLPHKALKEPGTLIITESGMHGLVCAAIGRYMIASNGEVKRTYRGPREKVLTDA